MSGRRRCQLRQQAAVAASVLMAAALMVPSKVCAQTRYSAERAPTQSSLLGVDKASGEKSMVIPAPMPQSRRTHVRPHANFEGLQVEPYGANGRIVSDEKVKILVQAILGPLASGIVTGNFRPMWEFGDAKFKRETSVSRLSQIYESFRQNKVDVSEFIMYTPQLTKPPELDAGGNLRLTGVLKGNIRTAKFDLSFKAERGIWRLAGIAFSVEPSVVIATSSPVLDTSNWRIRTQSLKPENWPN